MVSRDSFSNWAEISLGAIVQNVRFLVRHTNAQVMAVVKSNAYGHGTVRVARTALRAGATWCGVARLEEALELRQAGLDCPILLLGMTPSGRMHEAVAARISITVWNKRQVHAAAVAAACTKEKARLHLKIDTGMSRLGVQPSAASDIAGCLISTSGILFEGIFTHFARAAEGDTAPTDEQERQFREVLDRLTSSGLRPCLVHAANSAATLKRISTHFDLVRVGIAMYGLHPAPDLLLSPEFIPALSWKTQLSQVKQLPSGRGLSYDHEYVTTKEERIGTLPVGYADGFRRAADNVVLVRGRKVSVVGQVCMDQLMVQLDTVSEAAVGDEVVLIGTQGDMRVTAEDVAQRWGTINYEVVTGIVSRVPRVYL